jgi:hypothetical protein
MHAERSRAFHPVWPARRSAWLALAAVTILGLSGCGSGTVQEAFGMDKRAPDEFAVVSRAPLIVPPDYRLRPPRPGASRPHVGTTADQARTSLTGINSAPDALQPIPAAADGAGAATVETTSGGQLALLAQVGASGNDPNVRRKLADENQALLEVEGELYTRLLQWRQPVTLGQTVDPGPETERLMANRAAGRPATEGSTPSITERRQSPLGGLVEQVF